MDLIRGGKKASLKNYANKYFLDLFVDFENLASGETFPLCIVLKAACKCLPVNRRGPALVLKI